MELKNYNLYFFFTALIGITILVLFILGPFLVPCVLAAVLAYLFFPLYKKTTNFLKGKRGLSASLTIIAILLIIIIPLVFVGILVFNESQSVVNSVTSDNNDVEQIVSTGFTNLGKISFLDEVHFEKIVNQNEIVDLLKSFSKNTISILQGAYKSISGLILNSFVVFFAVFYFLIDGKKIINKLKELSPIKDKYEDILIVRFNSIVRALMRETFLIAVIQGALSGILFWSTGVTSPILLGVLAGIFSLLPTIGAALIWLPVGIIMIIIGNPVEGLIILIAGALVVSTVDNFLRPKLMGRSAQVHPLLILLSTLGGLFAFGLAGFIIGPILMALFLVMWEIYSLEFKKQLKEFNK